MQKLQLSIPEPCHENWQQMTPTEQGRYCNACAKEVIDFSMMTDTEVLNYFTHTTHDKVCGRALPSQLDRTITRPKESKKRLFWYWNYIVMFFMFFSKNNNAKAQGNVRALTASELSIVSPSGVCDALAGKIAGARNVIVKGKVTDKGGNPVSFAFVKIKGNGGGLSADANGEYSIRINGNEVLLISGAGYKEVQIPVGKQKVINTVLEKDPAYNLKEVVVTVAGGMMRRDLNKRVIAADTKYTATFQVKDDRSSQPIDKAKIIIAKNNTNGHDTAFADKAGSYTWKDIKKSEHYFIKVEAYGYETNEFTITEKELSEKKTWQVLLKKTETAKPNENTIRLGGISTVSVAKPALYVVDGTIVPNGNEIDPADIESISVLQGPAATALFGSDASNGAIVITTRKTKVKELKEVVVFDYSSRVIKGAMGSVSYVRSTSLYKDVKARVSTILTDSIKVYPNPVEPGGSFHVALKLKQTGNHQIQITDAAGRTILQKQINAAAKEYKEIINADSKWSGGVYYIRVFDNKNQLISKSSFIVR